LLFDDNLNIKHIPVVDKRYSSDGWAEVDELQVMLREPSMHGVDIFL